MSTIKIALGQILVEGGEPERNFERAHKMIVQAKKENCSLIVLPETIDFAWTHPSSLKEAKTIPGDYSALFCSWAKESSLYVCVGLTEKRGEKNYNTAILINPEGEIILKYSKINLLTVEFPFYEIGSSLAVVDTPLGRIGLNICADNYKESTHIAKTLASMGADLILSPSSWTVDHYIQEDEDPYRDKWLSPLHHVCHYFNTYIVSVTSVGYIVGGPYEGKKMVGCSLVVGPEGLIKQGLFNEFAGEMTTVDIPIKEQSLKGIEIGQELRRKGYNFEW
ncbi:MAG: carbon-nitrogen hydrolase family protein [Chitinophagales bacterium]